MIATLLTYLLLGVALGAVLIALLLTLRGRRRAREEAAEAERLRAAVAAEAAAESRDDDPTYPIVVHREAAYREGYEAGLRKLQEATRPPIWQYRSSRRQPHHDMTQPGTPAQRAAYDPWQPLREASVDDD